MFRFRLASILLLTLILVAASAPLFARDLSGYGRYLGVRLRMYQEAYESLDKAINEGSDSEKRRARQFKAEVMRSEADHLFSQDGDADKQRARYLEAVKVFGEGAADTPQGAYDKAKLQLDIAKVLQRSAPEEARKLCDEAIIECDKQRQLLLKKRPVQTEWNSVYKLYCKLYYTFCYGHYVKALTYPAGDPNREPLLAACEKELGGFQFDTERDQGTTEEEILSFELLGDLELARGKTESAVGKFLYLAKYMEEFSPNANVGRFALENSYLRAAAILTSDLDYDPKFLTQTINLYNEAFNRYGTVRGLEYQFKAFQLFRISAQIKLGDTEKFQSAVDLLFKLANDRDPGFRRQAISVLADIAVRDKLDNELRFKCATAAYGDLDGLAVSVLIRLAQAHQALLASCNDEKTFETYAPACFERAGKIYFRMFRFLDAALVYREGATRTAYFMNKFDAGGEVPAHMQDRCALITNGQTLHKFPSEMASQYFRNAKLLLDAEFGEPGNREFQALLAHAELVKATLGGDEALRDKEYNDAFKRYQEGQFVAGAVRFANLPGTYKKYHLAMALAATAYLKASETATIQRVTTGANAAERESDEWFAQQKARHAEGMGSLPAGMWQGHEAHWDAVMNRETKGPVATWHKMMYYFKRYFLVEAAKAWTDIEPLLAGDEKPDYVAGILAVAQHKAALWLRANPTGKGPPDADLGRIGKALYYYVLIVRNPPDNDAVLRNAYTADAVRILTPYQKLFETHLDDPRFKKATLSLSVFALADSGNVPAAEAAYVAYKEAFPQEELGDLARRLYLAIQDHVLPQVVAMTTVSTKMQSLANQLKKNMYSNIGPSYVEDNKKLAAAKTDVERQSVLANHFWNEWVVNQVFGGSAAADITKTLPDVQPALKQYWDEMAKVFPQKWGDAVYAELEAAVKRPVNEPIAASIKQVMQQTPRVELMDKLRAMRDADPANQALSTLYSSLELATKELRYFVGAACFYELAGHLQSVADEVNERCRPRLTFVLKYYEEFLLRTGKAGAGLDAAEVRRVGKQYFMIRDWNQAIKYLQDYLAKYGGVREYGPEEDIFVDTRLKSIGKAKSGEELEVKYLLGKAYLERYKAGADAEDLKKAALLMRRCWCFNLLRDANEVGKAGYKLVFQKEMEDYYLYIGQSMAEIFQLMFAAPAAVDVAWPKYVNRYTRSLEVSKDKPVQEVPVTKPEALWQAGQIQLGLWTSFQKLDPTEQYKYRKEFRDAFLAWLEINIQWVNTYGNKDMGIAELKGGSTWFATAVNTGRNEQDIGAVYMSDSTKAYVARVKDLTDKLEAACKKAGIPLNG